MERKEIQEFLAIINENDDNHVFTPEDWIVSTVNFILSQHKIDNIDLYGKKEVENFKEDLSSLGTEVSINADSNFVSARSTKIELYSRDEEQFLDFEIDNVVSIIYNDNVIKIIDDMKETNEVDYNEDSELLLLRTEYVYTSDRGLSSSKVLTIYVPVNLSEEFDEEVDF